MPEYVPDGDDVSRLLFAPSMGVPGAELVWDNVFQFPSDQGYCESVVWRKYALTSTDVHELGCGIEKRRRDDNKQCAYMGAITAVVGRIRALKSLRGIGFTVAHAEEDGVHHVHIKYDRKPSPNDKAQLKSGLKHEFGPIDHHQCQ